MPVKKIACTARKKDGSLCMAESIGRDDDGRHRCNFHSKHSAYFRWNAKTPEQRQHWKEEKEVAALTYARRKRLSAEEMAYREDSVRSSENDMIPIVPLGKLMPRKHSLTAGKR